MEIPALVFAFGGIFLMLFAATILFRRVVSKNAAEHSIGMALVFLIGGAVLVVPLAICISVLIAWFEGAEQIRRNPPRAINSSALNPATKEFTAESRGLKFAFRYPAAWKLDPAPTPWATLAMTLIPPDEELGTRIVFVLVDGDMAAKMIANGPMVPRAAAVVGQSKVDIGGVAFARTEWRGTLAGEPTHRHSVELQGDIGGRCIVLQCYTSAPEGKGADADRRFEKWRVEFEGALATAHLEAP